MEADLANIYTFAVWMTGDRHAGLMRAMEVVGAAPTEGFVGWASAILEPLVGHPRGAVFKALDDLLRTELTVTAGDHPQVQRDPHRLHVLQWHLKRFCLFTVMQGISTMPRAIFVMVEILGFSQQQIGAMFGMVDDTVRVNYRRANQELEGYLGARCQHITPANPCRCATRLGVALEHGFVGWPERPEEAPDRPVFLNTHSSVAALYRSLPSFAMSTVDDGRLRV